MLIVRTAQIRSGEYRLRTVPGESWVVIRKLWQTLRPRLGTTGCESGPEKPGPLFAFVRSPPIYVPLQSRKTGAPKRRFR
jgi:hypothetical protein